MNHKFTRIVLFAALMLLGVNAAFADVYATIHGTVTDPSGAVIAGAQITATNTQTGVGKTTTSQTNGLYEFLQLPIGPYVVTVTKQGFKTYKSSEITLTVNQSYDLTPKLEIGSANETVEVRANAVQVETTSIQQQTLINSSQIVDLPLNGRNFTQLEQLAPGVMSSNDRFGTFSVNGSQSNQSNYLINGTDSNDIALNTPGLLVSPDAIQEFNLISSTINPEYGRNSGGIVNAVIKNGTNQWHGGIFDFYRDTFLNARNFFTVGPQAPIFHQNQFGGTLGGPILKDKTFFFLSYQGTYNATAAQSLASVFTEAQRAGNFSSDAAAIQAGGQATPFPLVGDDGVLHPAGTPFFGTGTTGAIFNCGSATTPCTNPAFGKIGTAGFNTISAGLLNNFVPHANSGINGFAFAAVNTSKTDQGIARIDHNFNQTNTLWGLFAENYNRGTQGLPFTGSTLPGFGSFSSANTKEITVAYIHTFSNTMLNEFRLGWHRLNFDTVEPQKVADPSTFGFSNIKVQNPAAAQLPVIAVTGLFTLGFSDNGPQPRIDTNYQVNDNFTKIVGKHTMKFGFDGRRFQVDNPFFFLLNGHFDFGGSGGFSSGSKAADFLLGIPDDYIQGSGAIINARAYEIYGYGQDQWKARNNLTLTLGAGYQVDTPYNNNQYGGKAFNCLIPGQQSTVFPTAPVSMNFPGDKGCNNSGTDIRYGHIAPRVGFAYSPQWGGRFTNGAQSKTSIRGGVGYYFNRYEEETALQNLGAPPFGLQSGGVGDIGSSPGFSDPWTDVSGAANGQIANKFPFVAPKPGAPVDFTFFEPMSLNTNDHSLSTPNSLNYNLNIQREFPSNTVVSVGYVGALGRHLYRIHELDPITLAGAANCVITKACGGSATARTFQHILFPGNSALGDPAFASWGTQFTDGTSNYNSFQVNVTKGMTHGLQIISSYTWSHSIDNGSGFENAQRVNPFFDSLNVGDSSQDARQRIVFGYVYQIPGLHKHLSWASDYIFGGWKLSGISTFQTGFPINITTSSIGRSLTCDALSFYGCWDTPNQVVAGVKTLDPRASIFGGIKNYWFDPSSFSEVPRCVYAAGATGGVLNGNVCGQFGNVRRNSLHGPGILNSDLALLKDTKIGEGRNLQLGLEAFNVFNHAQFSNPSGNRNSANFGRTLSTAVAPRIVQLRLKFNF